MKDYYAILGIKPDASEADIKTAYRNLAKQYHPDINKSPEAEAKFKEVNEAYTAITNGTADIGRDDPFDDKWNDYFRPQRGDITQSINPNIEAEIEVEFLDACFGAEKSIHYAYFDLCSKCEDTKKKKGEYNYSTCATCNGTGRRTARNGFMVIQTMCNECMGYGKKVSCDECHGTIFIRKNSEISIKFPVGIDEGKILRASGRGNTKGKPGEFGDLLLYIHVKDHPVYNRAGNDIYSVIEVDYDDCILGNTVQGSTIHGLANVDIPECSNNNTVVCAKKHGIKKEGDHYFRVMVKMPKSISQKERKILSSLNKSKREKKN